MGGSILSSSIAIPVAMLGRPVATTAAAVMPVATTAPVLVPFVPTVAVAAAAVALAVVVVLAAAVVPIAMIATPLVPAVTAVHVATAVATTTAAIFPPAVVLFVAGTLLVLGRLGRAGSRVLFGLLLGPRRLGDRRSRTMPSLFAVLARTSVFHVRGPRPGSGASG